MEILLVLLLGYKVSSIMYFIWTEREECFVTVLAYPYYFYLL